MKYSKCQKVRTFNSIHYQSNSMKYQKALLFVLLISFPILCVAQDTHTDSLMTILLSAADDTLKVITFNALADHLYRSDPSDAIDFGNQARELAEKLNDQKGLALALKNIGLGHYIQGKYVEASIHWEQSLKILESLGDETGIANLIGNLGAVHSSLGDIAKAIEYYLRALKMSEDLGDSIRMATCLLNIGVVYSDKSATFNKAL